MPPRELNVLHVLVPRRLKGKLQFLFFPHQRWQQTGASLLALPSKKFSPCPACTRNTPHLEEALAAVFRDDLGLTSDPPPDCQPLDCVLTNLVSPTFLVPTTYAISPVLTPVPSVRHANLARHLGGEWLTPQEALGYADLSPTARAVLQQCNIADWGIYATDTLLGSSRDRAWTDQLLAARFGDLDSFGSLLEQMWPFLRIALRRNRWTRALRYASEDIDEALAEGTANALGCLDTFDPSRGTAWSWLWSITRNAGVAILRRRCRRPMYSLHAPDTVPGRAPDPANLAEGREELALARARIAEALEAAGAVTQRIWEMRFIDELPYATIAARLGLPVGTVATRVHQIRNAGRPTPCRQRSGRGARKAASI